MNISQFIFKPRFFSIMYIFHNLFLSKGSLSINFVLCSSIEPQWYNLQHMKWKLALLSNSGYKRNALNKVK